MVLLSCWVSEGGIQHVNRSLIEFFKAYDKYDITVLILLDTQSDIESHIKHERSKILIKGFAGSKLRFSLRYTKELLSKKYDFIWFDHIHLAPLMIMAIFRRIKYALMIYGGDVLGRISVFQKIALYKAMHILSISKYTKEIAKRQSNIFKKAEICYLGLDIDVLSANTLRNECFTNKKTILIVARMDAKSSYSKGHRELLEAVILLKNRVPNLLLIMVGGGTEQNELKKFVKEKNIEDKVVFTGVVPTEKLYAYYRECDVFAMPSSGEGFGLVYLEAMAHSKPCIAGNVDAAKEVILHGKTGFCVDPKNINELADCLFLLLTNSELRIEMGKAGKKRYLENFTKQKFYTCFEKIIN